VFYKIAFTGEEHEKYLSEDYFPVVGQIARHPRYLNKRIVDPFIKMFVDEEHIEVTPNWGLPKPNPNAAYKSLSKYGKDMKPMSEEQVKNMNLAWDCVEQHFGLYMRDSEVTDYHTAKEHLDWSTSVGAPFNTKYIAKKDLFEAEGEVIDAWLQEDWNTMADDPQWTCLFTNSLKEEMRPKEKIEENSIRTFLSGGLDAVVHGTRLFLDMNEKMYASHILTASAVGMSPLKGNWDILYRKLNIFPNGYALDESQYDSSLRAYMMWACARFRWNMLAEHHKTERNLQRIKTYYRNLINTVVVCPDGVLVMKKTGNPSGSVNTISDNTLILYALMSYAWMMLAPPDFKSYSCFEAHTAKALVGDDNTWTVSDDAHVFYNARTVIEVWKQIGVTTTTDSLEARKAVELDFLSAHTVFIRGVAVPLYSREKLLASLLHAPREHLTPATTLERTAGMLCIGWTDLPFRHFCRDLIAWLMENYDKVLRDDPRWIAAKCQIQSDERYLKLFTGRKRIQELKPRDILVLKPQSLGTEERTTPRNNFMQANNSNKGGRKPRRKNQNKSKKPAQKQKKKNTARPRKAPKGARQRAAQFHLSMCAKDYLSVLTNPFQFIPRGVCIPDLYDSPSKKERMLSRGFFVCGAAAVNGFVMVDTASLAFKDLLAIYASNGSYVSDGFPVTNATTGVTAGANAQAPYTSAQVGVGQGNVQYRIVGVGLRIRYTGTELNRGGRIIPFRHPQNAPFAGYTVSSVLGFNQVGTSVVDRRWHCVAYIPIDSSDYEYKTTTVAGSVTNIGCIGFITTNSGGTTPTQYEWEVVSYVEYTGTVDNVTPSHSDIGGMSAIRNFLEGGFDGDPGTTLYSEVLRGVSKMGPTEISGYIRQGATLASLVM
jgi:uncharacterized protein YeaC (DUF1315 family)